MGILIKAPQDRAREEGMAIGRAAGRAEGREEGIESGIERGLERGFAQGTAAERERWQDYNLRMQVWYARYSDALKRGEPFNEPPPSAP